MVGVIVSVTGPGSTVPGLLIDSEKVEGIEAYIGIAVNAVRRPIEKPAKIHLSINPKSSNTISHKT